ncbi:hypothetical protein OFB58_25015 [Escherichia coli]|nr:hypothetical protein [Escherichia coli]
MEEGTEDVMTTAMIPLCAFSFPLLMTNELGLHSTPLVRFIFLYLPGFITLFG